MFFGTCYIFTVMKCNMHFFIVESLLGQNVLPLSSYFAITSHHDDFVSLSTEDLYKCV